MQLEKYELIRFYRQREGMTQEDLAKAIGVRRSVISKYENGLIEPSITQLKNISKVLHIPIGDLLGIDPKEEGLFSLSSLSSSAYGKDVHLDRYGKTIRDLRKKSNLKIKDFSTKIGISSELLEAIESGIIFPGTSLMRQISEKLNINYMDLTGIPTLQDRLNENFQLLNDDGQKEAVKRVEELTEISRYQKKDEPGQE